MYATLIYVNKFASISKLMQSRKDKINSKDIKEIFLFSLFDSSFMLKIVEKVCKVILFLTVSGWCSLMVVSVV